ncbi:type II toxin-antitoxin system HicB family antitoxin [Enterococcus diestrammenae]|uniref:HicB-like antitoxin of toxin-antitoxin system domain-containing protein n=1 Tax=Enterococcus diestrammenae TaxID=1155073 RepID=A0ABV0F1P5_9ENTE|nr:type II toxin-antitoxin system HicB family antitoxin [Enterococcus diestrammenae]KAF1294792.1 pilus biosynthesis protein HicB [Enterococcus diestrammenae]
MLVYPALFDQGEKYIFVTFPDVPVAITQGKDVHEAYSMAEEVLGLALEDQNEFPEPSSVDEVQKNNPGKTVALIGIDLAAYRRKYHSKTVRKNVTVPEWLNNLAASEQINFSQTLTEALKEKLGV